MRPRAGREAARIDEEEDRRYGKGRTGDEMPPELLDPATRMAALKAARERAEAAKKRELAEEESQRRAKIEGKRSPDMTAPEGAG